MQTHSLQPLVIWNNIQVLAVIIYRHRRAKFFLTQTDFSVAVVLRMRVVFAGVYNGVRRFQTRDTFEFYKLSVLKSTVCPWRHNRGGWSEQCLTGTQVDWNRGLRSCCRGPLFSLSSAVFSLRLCVKPSGELPQNSTLWCQQTDVNILLKQQQTVRKTVLWRSSIFRTLQAEWNICISTYIWTTAFIRFCRQAFLHDNT